MAIDKAGNDQRVRMMGDLFVREVVGPWRGFDDMTVLDHQRAVGNVLRGVRFVAGIIQKVEDRGTVNLASHQGASSRIEPSSVTSSRFSPGPSRSTTRKSSTPPSAKLK